MKKLHLSRRSWTAASSVKQHKPSSSRRALTSRLPSNRNLVGNLTYFGQQTSLSQRWRERHVATSAASSVPLHVSANCACAAVAQQEQLHNAMNSMSQQCTRYGPERSKEPIKWFFYSSGRQPLKFHGPPNVYFFIGRTLI